MSIPPPIKRFQRLSRRKALSLVELLVTIAIVAILAGLTVPAVSKVREKAKVTKKVSNLRQVWIAHSMFIGENDGRIVPAQEFRGSERYNWRALLAKYLLSADTVETSEANKLEVFIDPCFPEYNPTSPAGLARTGFAMNARPGLPEDNAQNAHWDPTPRAYEKDFKLINLTHASKRIFLADSSTDWFYNTAGKAAAQALDMTRHQKNGMALMYDGSTKLLTVEESTQASEDPEKLKL